MDVKNWHASLIVGMGNGVSLSWFKTSSSLANNANNQLGTRLGWKLGWVCPRFYKSQMRGCWSAPMAWYFQNCMSRSPACGGGDVILIDSPQLTLVDPCTQKLHVSSTMSRFRFAGARGAIQGSICTSNLKHPHWLCWHHVILIWSPIPRTLQPTMHMCHSMMHNCWDLISDPIMLLN